MKAFAIGFLRFMIYALAIFASCSLFYGHLGGGQWGLHPIEDYISRYAAMMPDGKWQYIVRAMMATGAMMVALGALVGLLSPSRCKRWILICYVLASVALVGVAYYPIERKALPQPELSTLDRAWNAVFQKKSPPSELPDRQHSSKMHQHAIEVTLFSIMIGGCLTFVAMRGLLPLKVLLIPIAGFILSLACFIYIVLNREHSQIIGLMQRLGFMGIYGWVLALTYHSRAARAEPLSSPRPQSQR